jgi:hypothetical protein
MKKLVVERPSYCLGLALRVVLVEPVLLMPVHPQSGDYLSATVPCLDVQQKVVRCRCDLTPRGLRPCVSREG